jgi:hypothetical protein
MRKTIRNWIAKPLMGAIVLACFAASAFAVTDAPQPAGAGLKDPIGTAAPRELRGLLVIPMAEPPYPALLIVDLLAVAGLTVVFRRRITNVLS